MIGKKFGNYQAIALLGEGGMGAVYLATHPEIGRQVAVKVLRKELVSDPGALNRFLNEARASNAIRHPNIVEILDMGALDDGQPYIAMELLEGESLSARLRKLKRLTVEAAVELGCQTASALGAAHRKGIVHRDLKPDNLHIIADPHRDEHEIIKVLDFGICKLQATLTGVSQTRTGTLMGTPIYMSPEQCLGTKQVDGRTDIYSLGVILFEMVCGRPPFVSEGIGELINMHINVQPEPPTQVVSTLPGWLDVVILKALAKKPDDRFGTMAQLEDALRRGPSGMSTHKGHSVTDVGALVTMAAAKGEPRAPTRSDRAPVEITSQEFGSSGAIPVAQDATGSAMETMVVRGWRRWILPISAAAIVSIVAVILIAAGAGKPARPTTTTAATPAAKTTTAPVAPPKPAPTPEAAPTPPPPAPVHLTIDSTPQGATVSDAETGAALGNTPLELERPRGGALKLRIEKAGYASQEQSVPLDEDRTVPIALPKLKARTPGPHRPAKPEEPAKL